MLFTAVQLFGCRFNISPCCIMDAHAGSAVLAWQCFEGWKECLSIGYCPVGISTSAAMPSQMSVCHPVAQAGAMPW